MFKASQLKMTKRGSIVSIFPKNDLLKHSLYGNNPFSQTENKINLIKHKETEMKTNTHIEKILKENGIDTSKMDRAGMNKLASSLFMAASPKVRQDTVKKQKENDAKLKKTQDRRKKAIFTELKPILAKFSDELLDLHLNSPKGHNDKQTFVLGTIGKYSREIKIDVTIQKKNSKAKQTTK